VNVDLKLTLSVFLFVLLMAAAISLYSGADRALAEKDRRMLHRLGFENSRVRGGPVPSVAEREEVAGPVPGPNPLARALTAMIDQAGLDLSATILAGIVVGLFLFGIAVSVVYFSRTAALVLASALAMTPLLYMRILRSGRLKMFGNQLPYVLDLLRSALEAGHTLLRALQLSAENSPEPIGTELRRVVEQVQVGISLPQALESIYRRIPEEELGFLAIAVRIQAQIGSSLAEILHHVAAGVRTRQRLQQQLRVLTSQSRASAIIVTLLPFLVLAAFAAIRPGYAAPLFHDPTGRKMLETAVVLDLLAFLTMRRVARVDY
jgi:tight adherence protein B